MAYVGTLAWAHETGGRLRPGDRLRLLGQALAFRLRDTPMGLLRQLGLSSDGYQLDLDALRIPDSSVAQAARAHVEAVSPP